MESQGLVEDKSRVQVQAQGQGVGRGGSGRDRDGGGAGGVTERCSVLSHWGKEMCASSSFLRRYHIVLSISLVKIFCTQHLIRLRPFLHGYCQQFFCNFFSCEVKIAKLRTKSAL